MYYILFFTYTDIYMWILSLQCLNFFPYSVFFFCHIIISLNVFISLLRNLFRDILIMWVILVTSPSRSLGNFFYVILLLHILISFLFWLVAVGRLCADLMLVLFWLVLTHPYFMDASITNWSMLYQTHSHQNCYFFCLWGMSPLSFIICDASVFTAMSIY